MHATNTLVKCKYCEMANYRQWASSTSSSSQRIYAYQFFPYFFIFNFFVFRLKWISWKEISWIGLALCVDILIVIMVKRNVEMEIERKRRRKKSCLPLKFNSIAELRLSLSLCDALCFFFVVSFILRDNNGTLRSMASRFVKCISLMATDMHTHPIE